MATRSFLVAILKRKTKFFNDETSSRHHFEAENSFFWRRDPFSSSFLRGKLLFSATRPFLVVILRWRTLIFVDETYSRRHFWAGNSLFWRRDSFSSSF
ncbi:hypothetical protein NST17_04200 [Caldifermentibacillus hisashii]|uniref:Uncharacterized protein n=1 Tax=Caldifermentibacillus hisashii TaxID=996558 RepID=A0ABU9JU92_9BACI